MENSSSSHHYACSTSQEIPRLLENLTGNDNYKTLHIKMLKLHHHHHHHHVNEGLGIFPVP